MGSEAACRGLTCAEWGLSEGPWRGWTSVLARFTFVTDLDAEAKACAALEQWAAPGRSVRDSASFGDRQHTLIRGFLIPQECGDGRLDIG